VRPPAFVGVNLTLPGHSSGSVTNTSEVVLRLRHILEMENGHFVLLGGLQKTTLIDFPGRVACTVFTVGCNFRCPFCHNKDLITEKLFNQAKLPAIKESDFFEFLKKRKKILDGVCITGGEPTIQSDLDKFCQKIRDLGLEVKLDSNGALPEVLQKLIENKLISLISMDIKTAFSEYDKAMGVKINMDKIKKSIKIILSSDLEYELRTTIAPTIHNQNNLIQMAKDLVNLAKSINYPVDKINYFIQSCRPENCLDDKFLKVKPFTDQQVKDFFESIKKTLPSAQIRGES